jgi:hypothetical protein
MTAKKAIKKFGTYQDQEFQMGAARARVFWSSGGWTVQPLIGIVKHPKSRHDSRAYAIRKARKFVRDNG